MRLSSLVLSLALYTSLSAAWPWPPSFQDLHGVLGIRQADDKSSTSSGESSKTDAASSSQTAEASKTAAATTAKETGDSKSSASNSAAETTGSSSTGKKGKTAKASKTAASSSISIDPAAGVGAISLISPAATSTTYIKIGEVVTFVWNYTSLSVTPSRINVVASNTDGAWTMTSNMTVKETGSVTWNTSDEATPLPMEKYTLVVYDAEEGVTAAPKAGYLSPYQGYQFAMYSPRQATDESSFFCVTCNGAITSMERQSLKVLLGTATITVFSFTWFACGFLGF